MLPLTVLSRAVTSIYQIKNRFIRQTDDKIARYQIIVPPLAVVREVKKPKSLLDIDNRFFPFFSSLPGPELPDLYSDFESRAASGSRSKLFSRPERLSLDSLNIKLRKSRCGSRL